MVTLFECNLSDEVMEGLCMQARKNRCSVDDFVTMVLTTFGSEPFFETGIPAGPICEPITSPAGPNPPSTPTL